KRHEPAIGMVGHAKHAPAQPAVVGKLATAFADGAGGRSGAPRPPDNVIEIGRRDCPVIETMALQVTKLATAVGWRLSGIAGQDLEICGFAEREQAVAGALSGMNPAKGGRGIHALGKIVLGGCEIGREPDEVVDAHPSTSYCSFEYPGPLVAAIG